MMDWTDRRCRAFHRILTRHARLYTEMVTADAVGGSGRARAADRLRRERASAWRCSLGGAEPTRLAEGRRASAAEFGYDREINLNCGCPSDRVQSGRLQHCLMREPKLVAECVAAMAAAGRRYCLRSSAGSGVDEQAPRAALFGFAEAVRGGGRGGAHCPCAQSLARGPESQGQPVDPAAGL